MQTSKMLIISTKSIISEVSKQFGGCELREIFKKLIISFISSSLEKTVEALTINNLATSFKLFGNSI